MFVFDIREEQWYYHEYPAAFTCGCLHGDYMARQYIYFGADDGRIAKLDSSAKDFDKPIITEFKVGPIRQDGRKFKAKRIWLNAEPQNDFTLGVYISADAGAESGPYEVSFKAGGQTTQQVKLQGGNKGRDIYLRLTTTDKINELQSFSITVMPKAIK